MWNSIIACSCSSYFALLKCLILWNGICEELVCKALSIVDVCKALSIVVVCKALPIVVVCKALSIVDVCKALSVRYQ